MKQRCARRRAGRDRVKALAAGGLLVVALGCAGDLPHLQSCEAADGLVPVCGFQNPEDLAVAPDGAWLIVSQYPESLQAEETAGSLVAYHPGEARKVPLPIRAAATRSGGDPSCTEPPDAAVFAPHGIDVVGDLVLVVNHGGREAIERFRWAPAEGAPGLEWIGCVPLPDDAMANDVVGLGPGALATTNMMPRGSNPVTLLRVVMGWDTGEVLRWSDGAGWSAWPGSQASAPNGLEVAPDGERLFIAAWGGQGLVRVDRDGSDRREVELGFHPDNLTWSADGRLLVAGQGGPVSGILACGERKGGTCGMPSYVVAIDPASLEVETLVEQDPARVAGAASVALEHTGELWIGTFAGDRLVKGSAP